MKSELRKFEETVTVILGAKTLKDAAAQLRVSDATLWRRMEDEQFQSLFRQAKRRVFEESILTLQKGANDAAKALLEIVNDEQKPPSVRVASARAILDLGLKVVEVEQLESRIEALEKRIAGRA